MPPKDKQLLYNNEEIRIVMVGKTGVGKSASANTILGEEKFKSEFTFESVTEKCEKADGEVDGQQVSVIDTPGVFDTKMDEKTVLNNISQCVAYASPGPNIFLVVIRLDTRFTEEEKQTVHKLQQIFGKEADKYSMVLFTHGNILKGKPIEECLSKSKELKELVDKCNGQCHVFDNNLQDRSQVTELLNKIRDITKKNGGSHYTTKMFQKAERAIEEEKQRILKEREKQRQKEQEDLKKKMEREHEQKIKVEKENLERQLRAEFKKRKAEEQWRLEQDLREKMEREHEQKIKEEKEKLERQRQAELEREKERKAADLKAEQERKARREAEESAEVRKGIVVCVVAGAAAGATVGAALGGPVGAAVGGVVGGAVGAIASLCSIS